MFRYNKMSNIDGDSDLSDDSGDDLVIEKTDQSDQADQADQTDQADQSDPMIVA